MLCDPCKARVARYNAARYAKVPKPWPAKTLCRPCRKALRGPRLAWRRTYVKRHRERVNEAQRVYRRRLKKAV